MEMVNVIFFRVFNELKGFFDFAQEIVNRIPLFF